jgi:hypothetical protein
VEFFRAEDLMRIRLWRETKARGPGGSQKNLYSGPEVARILGITRQAVAAHKAKGHITPEPTSTRTDFYSVSEIKRLLEYLKNSPWSDWYDRDVTLKIE